MLGKFTCGAFEGFLVVVNVGVGRKRGAAPSKRLRLMLELRSRGARSSKEGPATSLLITH